MGRLLLIVVLILGALTTCAICYLATIARMWRAKGWLTAVLGAACFPYAYVWCWRHRPTWTRVWTGAFGLLVALVAFLEMQLG
jgi:hypothetical protein